MLIKDEKGKFEITVDPVRCIAYDKNIGLWDPQDFERYHNIFVTKVVPQFKGKKWAKCSDLREYKTSNISSELKAHLSWAENNGFSCAAIVLDSTIIKMQMNRSKRDVVEPYAFASMEEADSWLKNQGY